MSKIRVKSTQPASPEATPQPAAPVHTNEPCPPDILLDLALQEPNRRSLIEYGKVIRTLRNQKKFTFREIAAWLKQYNVEADHNAIYREYTRTMPEEAAQAVAMAEEELERREEGRA